MQLKSKREVAVNKLKDIVNKYNADSTQKYIKASQDYITATQAESMYTGVLFTRFCPKCYRYTTIDDCPKCDKRCIPWYEVTWWQKMIRRII
jgi:hypothetical protein